MPTGSDSLHDMPLRPALSRRAVLMVLGSILVAVGLCYHHTVQYPFVNWDDYPLIRDNPYLKRLDGAGLRALFNPYVTGSVKVFRDLTYAVDHRLWGQDTFGYHLTSLGLYVTASLLVFFLLRRILGGFFSPWLGALLFVVHPLHVEAVTWLSARKESLCASFFLLSLLSSIRMLESHGWRRCSLWGASFLFYVVAIFCKETAVILPVIVILYRTAFGRPLGRGWRAAWCSVRSTIPFFVVAAAFTAMVIDISSRINVLKPLHGGSLGANLLSALLAPFMGLRLLFVPVGLSARYANIYLYDFLSLHAILSYLCLLGLLLLAWDTWKRARVISFAILWYFITLAPVSNLVPISTLIADRYLFLPSIALCLVAAWVVRSIVVRASMVGRAKIARCIVRVSAAALLVSLGIMTYRRNLIWRDNYTLWGSVVRQDPYNTLGHLAFGNVAREQGDDDLAIRSFQRAVYLNDDISEAHQALGELYLERGEVDRAIRHFNRCLTGTAEDLQLHVRVGEYFLQANRLDDALVRFSKAVELDSGSVGAHMGLIDTYARRGEYDVATSALHSLRSDVAARIDTRVYQNLGIALYRIGEYETALEWFARAIQGDTTRVDGHLAMGNTHHRVGDLELAEVEYRAALSIDPSSIEALANLAGLYLDRGKTGDAITTYRTAMLFDPGNAGIRCNLGLALYSVGAVDEAIRTVEATTCREPAYEPGYVNLAYLYLKCGDPKEALTPLEEGAARFPESAKIQFNLAYCRALLGEPEASLRAFERALDLGFMAIEDASDFLALDVISTDTRFGEAWERARKGEDPLAPE